MVAVFVVVALVAVVAVVAVFLVVDVACVVSEMVSFLTRANGQMQTTPRSGTKLASGKPRAKGSGSQSLAPTRTRVPFPNANPLSWT